MTLQFFKLRLWYVIDIELCKDKVQSSFSYLLSPFTQKHLADSDF